MTVLQFNTSRFTTSIVSMLIALSFIVLLSSCTTQKPKLTKYIVQGSIDCSGCAASADGRLRMEMGPEAMALLMTLQNICDTTLILGESGIELRLEGYLISNDLWMLPPHRGLKLLCRDSILFKPRDEWQLSLRNLYRTAIASRAPNAYTMSQSEYNECAAAMDDQVQEVGDGLYELSIPYHLQGDTTWLRYRVMWNSPDLHISHYPEY